MKLLTKLFVLTILITAFQSCKEDPPSVKTELFGDWDVTSYVINLQEVLPAGATITYEFRDDCTGFTESINGPIVSSTEFTYTISDDKTKLSIQPENSNYTSITDAEITVYSSTNFEYEGTDSEGDFIFVKMEK